MPIVMQIVCDGCGTVKKEANHWYIVEYTDHAEAKVRPMAHSPIDCEAKDLKYYCGRRCVAESLDRWMDRLSLATPQAAIRAA
jgi:hypothetical protein